MTGFEDFTWRKSIVTQLQERNRTQTQCFEELINHRKYTYKLFKIS